MKSTFWLHYLFAFLFLSSCTSGSKEPTSPAVNEQDKTEQNRSEESTSTTSDNAKHYGLDVSHFQGDVLATIKASDDLDFAICKATQGAYFVDPMFKTNWREIKKEGMIRGTYHFYDCSVDPQIQAQHFYSTVGKIEATDIAPVLDIEQGSMSKDVDGKQMVEDILTFLRLVEQQFGRKPILYTDYDFAQEYFKDQKALAEYDLWLAEYSGGASPKIPELWKERGYFIWQKSSSYSEESMKVDYDEYKGNLKDIVK
jgi:lysozyme